MVFLHLQRSHQPWRQQDREYQVLWDTLYFVTVSNEHPVEDTLREMVKQVSEDKENCSLEFNEYLTMLGIQNIEDIQFSALIEAFR